MDVYLPIAELPVNMLMIAGMGLAVGFLSGMFGVGGGFLMTPMLIFWGIPPAIAVGTQSMQVVASSITGALAHFRHKAVDVKMGLVLLVGGMGGSVCGVFLFSYLRALGQIDLVISLTYVVLLTIIGALMLRESLQAIWAKRSGRSASRGRGSRHNWVHGLPIKMRFRQSRLYISAIPPVLIGFFVGVLAAILGVGGGFIMVPAMIYLLRMPTTVVIGTSLFQIVFVTALVGVMHAVQNQAVDVVLGLLLVVGGVVGAQLGARAGHRLQAEQLRLLLALLVLGVGARLGYDLVTRPADLYSIARDVVG